MERIVYVDKITSGKGENSVFSFVFQKKQINKPPFLLKSKNKYYNYNHHLDEEDILRIQGTFPNIHPYSGGYVDPYIDKMTDILRDTIISGNINKIMSIVHNHDFSGIIVKWAGEMPKR